MIKLKSCLWISCIGTAALFFTAVYAAPGQLANAPLFVGSTSTTTGSGAGVPSNVFFQIDDSGSMDWDTLTKKYWHSCLYDPQNEGILAKKTCPASLQVDGGLNLYDYYDDGNNFVYDFHGIDNLNNFTTSTITSYMNYEWRIRAAQMNTIYYDPGITYLPWKKGNADGSACAPASFTAAKNYPTAFDCGNATTQSAATDPKNLTGFVFEIAHDTHGYAGVKPSIASGGSSVSKKVGTVVTTTIKKGINRVVGANNMVDFWDEHTRYTVNAGGMLKEEIKYFPSAASTTGTATCSGTTPSVNPAGYATVTGCGSNNVTISINSNYSLNPTITDSSTHTTGLNEWGRTLDEEKQNIANWYQYYRQRINIAKASVGEVIDANPKYRYGLSTIWNKIFIPVPSQYDPVGSTTLRTNFLTPNKDLLKALYARNPSGTTPLPPALYRVGQYFMHKALPPTSGSTLVTYADPIVYECQQNFAILQTDGYWNDDLDTTAQSIIQDADGDGIGSTSDVTSSQRHSTVADVAQYYYSTDLSALNDKVPITTFDANPKQHMVTYTVAFGLDGYLLDTNNDGQPDFNTNTKLPGTWTESSNWGDPSGSSDKPEKIDDLWHAAYNARGLFVSAGSPDKIAAGFKHIFEAINNAQPQSYAGSATAVSFNSSTLIPSVSAAYLAQFSKSDKGSWSGDVLSYSFDEKTKSVKQSPDWNASTVLDARVNATTKLITNPRTILTFNNTTGKSMPFLWGNLTTEQKNDLLKDASVTKAQARLNYLRGDRNNEGAGENFRVRDHLLGDIIHSDPLSVGKPSGFWPNRYPFPATLGETYNEFKLSQENRQRKVYAGANDGMLHAFSATDGSELMAYIPNTVFSANTSEGLHYLTQTDYDHRYYVDMPSVVSDVFIDTGPGRSWHSVLISGEMAGGKGIFALDITDPSQFSEANAAKVALWEFDSSDDSDMGYSFSLPSVAMMPNGKWAVIFGNGYNNNGKGQAALFIAFVEAGLDGNWSSVSGDYIKIELPVAGDPTAAQVAAGINCNALATCNGLSSVQTYSTKQNSVTDRVYAGDLKGNMWAFDLSSTNPADWKVAYGTVSAPKPLFTATHHIAATAGGVPVQQNISAPKPQPITTRPLIVKNARAVGNSPNVLVLFGTGQYLISGDVSTSDMQSFYGVWDHGFSQMTPANLIEQTFLSGPFYNEQGLDVTDKTRLLSSNTVKYAEAYNKTTSKCLDASKSLSNCAFAKNSAGKLISNQGWFVNFNKANKERLGADPDVTDDVNLFFNTWIPGSETTTVNTGNVDLCAPAEISTTASGTGYKMVMNLFTGTATDKPVIDTNSNGNIGTDDLIRTDQTVTSTTKNYVVAGEVFLKGLPASSSFFNNQQFVPGTSDSTIGGGLSDAVAAAQAAADAAQAASDAANADYDAKLLAQKVADDLLTDAVAAKLAADAVALANPGDAAAQQAAIAAAKAVEDAAAAAEAAAAESAAAKAKARRALVALNIANKKLGVASNQNIKELVNKPAMARIGWQELRND